MTTTVPKLQMTETTVKPLIIMSPDMSDMEEENMMPITTVTSEGKICVFCLFYLLLNHTNNYMCFLWYLLSIYLSKSFILANDFN